MGSKHYTSDYIKSLMNKTFGRLTIIGYDEEMSNKVVNSRTRRYVIVRCSCDKHTEFSVRLDKLQNGLVQSCGCLHKESASKNGRKNRKDMIGKTFDKLYVIDFDHKDKDNRVYYKCKCECGNIVVVNGANLRSGNTTSCGCSHKNPRTKRDKDGFIKLEKRNTLED